MNDPICDGWENTVQARRGRTLVVQIDSPLADGVVTVEGECTNPSCVRQSTGGCTLWQSEMKGPFQSTCIVTLTLTDGNRLQRTARLAKVCGDPFVDVVRFETDGGG
jgi:hypothetical protein